jgi:dienelactone hydrolase
MTIRGRIDVAVAIAGLVLLLGGAAAGQAPGPQGAEQGPLREQRWLIPTDDGSGRLMRTTVYRPAGEAPRQLVIINHGAPPSGPATAPPQRFEAAASWFVPRGYVVAVPQRRGYGETGGRFNESYGPCDDADFVAAGREAARDVGAALAFMRRQPFVRPDGTLIVGQSAGGWATIAFSTTNPPGVTGMINFAGGRGKRSNVPNVNCSPNKLVQAVGVFGRSARVPMLWIYTQNDSYFDPGLSGRMAEAYRKAGGNVQYVLLPAFGQDGHALFRSGNGATVWSAPVQAFLDRMR